MNTKPHHHSELHLIGAIVFTSILLLMTSSCSKPERPSITLHEAAEQGNLEQLQRHLYWGCDINAVNSDYDTPLGLAAKKGHVDMVKLLVSKGANIAKSGALNYAVQENQLGVLDALVSAGADINSTDRNGYTVLHAAGKNKQHSEAAAFLIGKGAAVNARSNDKSTPLHIAAINDNRAVCELLISKGAEVNARSDKGQTRMALKECLELS